MILNIRRKEILVERVDYIQAKRKCASIHGIIISVVGKNTIFLRQHNDIFIEIIRDQPALRFFRILFPRIKRNVSFFTKRRNGDIYFKV